MKAKIQTAQCVYKLQVKTTYGVVQFQLGCQKLCFLNRCMLHGASRTVLLAEAEGIGAEMVWPVWL